MSATSSTDAWAVGNYDDGTQVNTLVEHWDGTAWSQVPSPNPGGSLGSYLSGVTAISPTDVWAVGYIDGADGTEGLIEHWDGNAWTQVQTQFQYFDYPGTYLQGISAASANDIWAVGAFGHDELNPTTLTLHWNGTAWTYVRSQDPSPYENDYMTGVSALSANNVWAVGYYLHNGWKPLTEHWNGSRWSKETSRHPGAGRGTYLNGVTAISATEAWAVGSYNSISAEKTLIDHWAGNGWTKAASPSPGMSNGSSLSAVSATSGTDVWAVGSYGTGTGTATLIEHWSGAGWTKVPSRGPLKGTGSALTGIDALTSTDAWAVGHYNNGTHDLSLILHWDGNSWTKVPVESPVRDL